MDVLEGILKNSTEPEWLEQKVAGDIRVWQIIFLCIAGLTTIVIIICCCIRFRIPRTKQQIEADFHRRKITNKFRQQLEKIQDSKMDSMSLKEALDVLHTDYKTDSDSEHRTASQVSSIASPTHSYNENSPRSDGKQKHMSASEFARLASKVAQISKFSGPKSPTSPTVSNGKIEF